MSRESLTNLLKLLTLFGRFAHHPKAIIVTEGFNSQKCLTVDQELTEIVATKKGEARLPPNYASARDSGHNPRNSVSSDQSVANAEACKVPLHVPQIGCLH
jgi:hypothetical protein